MATNFPGSLDSFTNPSATDKMDSVTVPHASQHANLNDAVEALEAKVGADSSAVTSSLDYKVSTLETDVAALETDVSALETDVTALETGYRYVQTVYFTSSGTFTKATYSWLSAVRVKCQGAGGGGGGTDTNDNGAGGAGAGGCAELFIEASSLSASVTVTVGSGGAGGAVNTDIGGSNGGNTGFGSYATGNGGLAGAGTGSVGGNGGNGTATGGLVIPGKPGGGVNVIPGFGGDAFLGHGGSPVGAQNSTTVHNNRKDGRNYGGGGAGAWQKSGTGTTGGNGANGIVIVELYA